MERCTSATFWSAAIVRRFGPWPCPPDGGMTCHELQSGKEAPPSKTQATKQRSCRYAYRHDCTRRRDVYSRRMKKIISTPEAPAALGPYSQAVRVGSTIYCAGQIPLDPTSGEIVSGGIENQTRRVLDNITAVLKAEGLTFSQIAKTTIFLTDLGDFQKVNEIYGSYFQHAPPARSTVQVAALPRGARVEIEVIAVADGENDGIASDTSG